jgi:hypothetical protein
VKGSDKLYFELKIICSINTLVYGGHHVRVTVKYY